MPNSLDFAALPRESFFDSRSLLIILPKQIEERLASLPQTVERVCSAAMFAELSAKQTEPWLAAAFLRAALADYCSIEEVQKADKPSAKHLRVKDSVNPLLHLLKLMRHLNIHVKTVQAERRSIPVSFGDQTFDMDVYVISNLEAADLAVLKNGKRYATHDIDVMVDWFSKAQLHWGAGYVVRVGIESLAQELCSHYGL